MPKYTVEVTLFGQKQVHEVEAEEPAIAAEMLLESMEVKVKERGEEWASAREPS
jgi:hypothetical protein